MRVCDISPLALETLHEVHRQSGFDYAFPKDFATPLFPVRSCVTDDNGRLLAAAALKVEAEAYLWMDSRSGSPETRWQAVQMLHSDLAEKGRAIGFDQEHCVLPPEVAERFGQRLEELGWKLARPWPLYVLQLR